MTRLLTVLLFSLPLLAQAASGAWSRESGGILLNVGSQTMSGPLLTPNGPIPASASITRISWRITLLNPPPPGLQIKLCTQARCVALDALAGQRALPAAMKPDDGFRFIYAVNARGQLRPPVNVVRQHLTVNYR
ncbi:MULTISPECIES: flagellar protein FlhE [Tenebrionibacter/Tenebrionicola group]|jgi:flagellar protein FlhE|uniref:Flagellar protein FlhE n=2 Tax=Tenebrionibacter/Tenebrionicola group TaxID=2969848 RepID=A0A8K0V455_9ENTR|nr:MULTISPECIES: flagellar protein FlhE [Tenebrionibacter/Tenebrionicola group]MBK4716737.1 flagellar protein FlhE [Tenebrionibacter intestinalis]MBV5096224.1 flagellar protein FlhE [Tenebrionicola larvae]